MSRSILVITDVRMPGMSGLELLAVLRERASAVDVVLSACDDLPTVAAAMRDGAADFLVKPLDLHQLRAVVTRVFADRQARPRRAAAAPTTERAAALLVGRDPASWLRLSRRQLLATESRLSADRIRTNNLRDCDTGRDEGLHTGCSPNRPPSVTSSWSGTMSATTTLRRALLATHVDAFRAHALPRMAALSLALLATGCTDTLPTMVGQESAAVSFSKQGTRPGADVVPGDLVLDAVDAPALASTCPSQDFTRNAWNLAYGHSQCLIVSPLWVSTTYEPYTLTDDIVLSVRIEKGKNGRITHVRLYGQDIIGDAGIAHETDWVPVAEPVVPSTTGFTLHVHATNVQVWRLDSHLSGGNRVEMIGTISIGDFIYPS